MPRGAGILMVAYSFKQKFVAPIRADIKTGTIRAPRKRHARVGEELQLYCGMRTSGCFKIVPNRLCLRLNEIIFDIDRDPKKIALLSNGVPIVGAERERFAICDGFNPSAGLMAFDNMVLFWIFAHGEGRFEGVHILWKLPA